MDDRDRFQPEALGGAPDTPAPADEIRERCEEDRDSLTSKETADCAGTDLADSYEMEEDGGS